MLEQKIDFVEAIRVYDHICIPTNGEVTRNSRKAIMGAGIALLAREMFPTIDLVLAAKLEEYGNVPVWLGDWSSTTGYLRPGVPMDKTKGRWCGIWSFPTKHLISQPSSLKLIVQSAKLLAWEMTLGSQYVDRFHRVALPKPGCGVGGLRWEDVSPALNGILDGRFVAIERP